MLGMDGKVVVITGAANGIGRATAGVFAAEGAQVVLVDIDLVWAGKSGQRDSCKESKGVGHKCDVSRGLSVKAMVEEVVQKFGRIDVLYANGSPNHQTHLVK